MALNLIRHLAAGTLPVFVTSPRQPSDPLFLDVVRNVLDSSWSGMSPDTDVGGEARWRLPRGMVQFSRNSGGLWVEHQNLWKLPVGWLDADNTPEAAENSGLAISKAAAVFGNVVSAAAGVSIAVEPDSWWNSPTRIGVWRRNPGPGQKKETLEVLDHVVGVKLQLTASDLGLSGIPVLGAEARAVARISPAGQVLAVSLGAPTLTGVTRQQEVVSRQEADGLALEHYSAFGDVLLDAVLAYQVIQAEGIRWLGPCWMFEAARRTNGGYEPLAPFSVPAVRFATTAVVASAGTCTKTALDEERDQTTANGRRLHVSWVMEKTSARLSPCVYQKVSGLFRASQWAVTGLGRTLATSTSWSGVGAEVNSAQLGVFVGHADEEYLYFSNGALAPHQCRWGAGLQWVITEACGALQHSHMKYTSAFGRWESAFQGVRSILGFASTQDQNDKQLAVACAFALAGEPLAREWFRSCSQHQPSGRKLAHVAGLFVVDSTGRTTLDDVIKPGAASFPVPSRPDVLLGLWIPTA